MMGKIRRFSTGATRDDDTNKPEPWKFTSPLVQKRFDEYMLHHRSQSDGNLRESDNWKKGISPQSYMDSMSRHVEDLRLIWDGYPQEARTTDITEALMAVLFNVQGMAHELLKIQYQAEHKE